MLRNDLVPFLIKKRSDDIESLFEAMQWHIHYVGKGGIASFGISALDIAWRDVRGKQSGQALWQMAGGAMKTTWLLHHMSSVSAYPSIGTGLRRICS